MPSATFYTAAHGDLEFTLCHRTPHWDLTVHNRAPRTLWIDLQTPVPPNGTYTISSRTRTPTYRLSVADKPNVWHYMPEASNLTVDAMRVAVTHGLAAPETAIYADFSEVPTRRWRAHSHALPLEVSVYGSSRHGAATAVQYRNTSATDTLTLGGSPLPPGETRTVAGDPWSPWTCLHDIYAVSATGQNYYCVTRTGIAGVYIFSHEREAPPAPAPVPAPPAPAPPAPAPAAVLPDPHFDAPAFYPHVLQQLSLREPALLTSILRSQGFTPGQIAAFQNSVAEL